MAKYRIIAEFNGRTLEVGKAETLGAAICTHDNIGTLFSDGSPHPMTVTVTVESELGIPIFQSEFYNSYGKQLYADMPLIEAAYKQEYKQEV